MGFKETFHKNVDMTSFPGKIPMQYRYTYGLAGERFFRALKDEGKFVGTLSPMANKIYCPPSLFCEETFEGLDQWVDLPNMGTVESVTVAYEDYKGDEHEEPVVMALIRLDGADTVLIHRLGCDPDEAYIGMRVEAVFKDKADRVGHLDDILHFAPVA